MYLKAMWLTNENKKPISISTILVNLLRIRQPSVVQMMKKLDEWD